MEHPNRLKQQQAKHTPLVESLLETVFAGRAKRDGDEALVREVIRLEAVNAELLAALKAIQLQALQSTVNDGNEWGREALAITAAAIAKAEGR